MRVTLGLRGDYAVRAMLALATAEAAPRPTSVRSIAERMAIPVRFLPHVMRDLTRANLVLGSTGRTGGYVLARPASAINLLQVIEAVEPDSEIQRCVLRGGPCGRDGRCGVHDVFFGASDAVRKVLSSASLADVAATPNGTTGIEVPTSPS